MKEATCAIYAINLSKTKPSQILPTQNSISEVPNLACTSEQTGRAVVTEGGLMRLHQPLDSKLHLGKQPSSVDIQESQQSKSMMPRENGGRGTCSRVDDRWRIFLREDNEDWLYGVEVHKRFVSPVGCTSQSSKMSSSRITMASVVYRKCQGFG